MADDWKILKFDQYRKLLANERKPCAFVNMDALDDNVAKILESVRGTGKTLRIATKSIRCPAILKHIVDSDPIFKGIMCFTVEEAAFLAGEGYDDLLVAYPSVQPSDMELTAQLARDGNNVSLIVDNEDHLDALGRAGRAKGVTTGAAIELEDRKSTRLNSSHIPLSRMPSSA